VIETGPSGLVFWDQQRFKMALADSVNRNRQFTNVAFERLFAFAVAGIAAGMGDGIMLGMTQMVGQFRF
jgi:hypothetical protein